MELSRVNKIFSLVFLEPKTHSLVLNEKKYILQKEKKVHSIVVENIQRNVVDFSIYSLLDGQYFFNQGGYFG